MLPPISTKPSPLDILKQQSQVGFPPMPGPGPQPSPPKFPPMPMPQPRPPKFPPMPMPQPGPPAGIPFPPPGAGTPAPVPQGAKPPINTLPETPMQFPQEDGGPQKPFKDFKDWEQPFKPQSEAWSNMYVNDLRMAKVQGRLEPPRDPTTLLDVEQTFRARPGSNDQTSFKGPYKSIKEEYNLRLNYFGGDKEQAVKSLVAFVSDRWRYWEGLPPTKNFGGNLNPRDLTPAQRGAITFAQDLYVKRRNAAIAFFSNHYKQLKEWLHAYKSYLLVLNE